MTYYKNRINLEVFHALADGMGAVNFFKGIDISVFEDLLSAAFR